MFVRTINFPLFWANNLLIPIFVLTDLALILRYFGLRPTMLNLIGVQKLEILQSFVKNTFLPEWILVPRLLQPLGLSRQSFRAIYQSKKGNKQFCFKILSLSVPCEQLRLLLQLCGGEWSGARHLVFFAKKVWETTNFTNIFLYTWWARMRISTRNVVDWSSKSASLEQAFSLVFLKNKSHLNYGKSTYVVRLASYLSVSNALFFFASAMESDSSPSSPVASSSVSPSHSWLQLFTLKTEAVFLNNVFCTLGRS